MIRNARSLGVLGYVLKCDAAEELVTAVLAAIDGVEYVSAGARKALGTRAR
jgi:DNA-binding NarL/FixJ family response regulator